MKPTFAMKVLSIVMILVLGTSVVNAQSKVGTTAAQFLGISVGPRAISMGSAYVASGSEVTSIAWNPGGFVQANRSEFAFSNTDWLAGTKFRWFGFMLNLDGENAIGISLTQLDYGEEEVTTVSSPEGTGELWSANDMALALSYSRKLTDRFSIGGSMKYITQNIWNETASNIAFDFGLLFVTGFNNMRLGMSMQNFGGDMTLDGRDLLQRIDYDPANAGANQNLIGKLKTDSWPIPLLFRVGVSMDVLETEFLTATVAVDALRPNDNQLTVNVGGEVGWQKMVYLRGGYKSFYGSVTSFNQADQQEGLSLGVGLRYHMEGVAGVQLDYAYNKFGLFGSLNSIAFSISF